MRGSTPGNGGSGGEGEAWAAIDEQRRALVRLLESLSAEEWNQPSLCDGWTVRQVGLIADDAS